MSTAARATIAEEGRTSEWEGHELSKRVLEGWTLLAQSCPIPRCHTPLVKNNADEIYCVKCRSFCISANKATQLGWPSTLQSTLAGNSSQSAVTGPMASMNTPSPKARSPPRPVGHGPQTRGSPQKAAREAADARMAERLLQGWTMLAESCPTPGCNYPLLQDRTGQISCVSCHGNGEAADDRDNVPDPNGSISSNGSRELPAHAPVVSSAGAVQEGEEGEGGDPQAIFPPDEFAAIRARRDAVSASLGRYMQQGWVLLDKTCPVSSCDPSTPLLRERKSGDVLCCGCNTHFSVDGAGLIIKVSSREGQTSEDVVETKVRKVVSSARDRKNKLRTPLHPPSAQDISPRPTTPAKRGAAGGERGGKSDSVGSLCLRAGSGEGELLMEVESEDEVGGGMKQRRESKETGTVGRVGAGRGEGGTARIDPSRQLAEKLMQGWSMLSECCLSPACNVPLMRDEQGIIVCVVCGEGGGRGSGLGLGAGCRGKDGEREEGGRAGACRDEATPTGMWGGNDPPGTPLDGEVGREELKLKGANHGLVAAPGCIQSMHVQSPLPPSPHPSAPPVAAAAATAAVAAAAAKSCKDTQWRPGAGARCGARCGTRAVAEVKADRAGVEGFGVGVTAACEPTEHQSHVRVLALEALYGALDKCQRRLRSSCDLGESIQLAEYMAQLGRAIQSVAGMPA
ncbi:unnamed protein product [Discosporangium mesarthrocarpum]